MASLSQLEMLGNIFLIMTSESFSFGQFEEQQAFEKSRKFLRQLEICFAENPAHHQKIIKVLQSCADCLPQEIAEVIRHPGISFLSKTLRMQLASLLHCSHVLLFETTRAYQAQSHSVGRGRELKLPLQEALQLTSLCISSLLPPPCFYHLAGEILA